MTGWLLFLDLANPIYNQCVSTWHMDTFLKIIAEVLHRVDMVINYPGLIQQRAILCSSKNIILISH